MSANAEAAGLSQAEKTTAWCLVALIASLLAIGLASSLILRHILQALPAAFILAVVMKRWRGATYAALAVFLFWLLIMTLIWLFLLGLARILTGTFSPAEITFTITTGIATALGIGAVLRARRNAALGRCLITFLVGAALQVFAMWLSLQPMFAHR